MPWKAWRSLKRGWRAKRARGLWPGRVVTDYLDHWVEQKPDATALVAWRTEEETETRLTWRRARARARPPPARSSAPGCAGRRGVVPAAELVGVRRAVPRHGAPGRGGEPADADLPPPRALVHAAARRVARAHRAGALPAASTTARSRASSPPRFRDLQAPWISISARRRAASCAARGCARRRHPAPLHLGHDRRAEGRAAHLEHAARRGGGFSALHAAGRGRRDLHALAARAPARLLLRHADVADARRAAGARRHLARGTRGAADRARTAPPSAWPRRRSSPTWSS